MPTLPQFFRHFVPKIRTALSSGSKGKSEKTSASTEQSGSKPRKAKPFSSVATKDPNSSFGDGGSYITLEDRRGQEVGSQASSDVGARGWSDGAWEGRERDDEEKGLAPLGMNGSHRI